MHCPIHTYLNLVLGRHISSAAMSKVGLPKLVEIQFYTSYYVHKRKFILISILFLVLKMSSTYFQIQISG